MSEATPYSVLFEPVRIGPVTARNRFYQVPHCNGMGHLRPQAEAAMRGVKAEGGWAVVCTQETEIHPTSDLSPYAENRIWDERDMPALRLMTDAIHEHGSLAAIETRAVSLSAMVTVAALLAPSIAISASPAVTLPSVRVTVSAASSRASSITETSIAAEVSPALIVTLPLSAA